MKSNKTRKLDIPALMQAYEAIDKALTEKGMVALPRLVRVAQSDTGQSDVCRKFLLGLYNGLQFPFDLTELRRLDADLLDDAVAVLHMDAFRTTVEIHRRIPGITSIFRTWAETELAARQRCCMK